MRGISQMVLAAKAWTKYYKEVRGDGKGQR